ncbi:hypothetical protein DYB31_003853 [Aphanomyces astaci]|uniref:PTM/DIR17-like Tudor domain-containing protein n=2 Tax=Aphanomyces astaci TaxID=112090 RepID=A0A397FI11_APHAT|nr:hypothetical protein DYB31_003853 [Aphanomyces astaci]
MEENNDAPSKTIIDHSHRDVSPPSGGIQTRATDDVVQHTSSGLGRHHRQTVQDNGSETESDTDNKSYPDQSSAGGSRDSGDRMQLHLHINPSGHGDQPHYREPVSTSDTSLDVNNRGGSGGGSVLSNLLVRPGLDNPNNQSDQQPSLPQLGQVHQSSGDVRLPAISLHTPSALGSYNNSRGGPPPLVDTTRPGQLSDLHRVASNAVGVNGSPSVPSRHRPDIATNRSNWIVPPSRPTNIDGIDRSPRSAYTTQSAVHAGRDDFDYPTYQPPESLVGQRIAKTFAGHGRFVGQVVKYNSQTELFTVVYADGDTEELTRENTMNLLIEDKRIHQSKPREPAMRKPAEQQQHPKRSLISPPLLTERDNETLNGLFERHAWPALAENGWRSEIQGGSTLYVYPPWSGKNTGEPEYFTSVADTILYLASQGELLRQCFPIEVHATLFAILDGIRGGASSKRGPPAEPLAGQVKRIKAESPATKTPVKAEAGMLLKQQQSKRPRLRRLTTPIGFLRPVVGTCETMGSNTDMQATLEASTKLNNAIIGMSGGTPPIPRRCPTTRPTTI